MGRLGTIAKWTGIGVAGVALVGAGTVLYARSVSDGIFAAKVEVPDHDFPIPFPLSPAEIEELRAQKLQEKASLLASAAPVDGAPAATPEAAAPAADPAAAPEAAVVPADDVLAGVDLDAIAKERAIARGKHLVEARFVCVECHGADFGGGTMVDDPMLGTFLGPNLTTGQGSRTVDYTAADWSRSVRHGVGPDGTSLVMPADDFFYMSDRELSDIVTYLRAQPPVDKAVPPRRTGPLAWVLQWNGTIVLAAQKHPGHDRPHEAEPPKAEVSATFGEHLSHICTGCHGHDFSGGPIAGGDPSWAPALNLTSDASGLGSWTWEQFETTMRTGVRPDGTPVKDPMVKIVPYVHNMDDTELRALWTYLQTVPPVANAY